MDGSAILRDFTPPEPEQPWTQAGASRAPARVPVFLHRDLSEQALRRPADPSFATADLEQARRDGFAAGRQAGLAEAAASIAAAEASALGLIAAGMEDAAAQAARAADEAAEALTRALVAAMGAVMPELVRRSALNEAGAMLAEVLPGLSREPQVTVEVPGALRGGIRALVDRLAPEHRGRVEVAQAADGGEGDICVRWSAGQARRRPDAVWQAVMAALAPALDALEPGESTHGG